MIAINIKPTFLTKQKKYRIKLIYNQKNSRNNELEVEEWHTKNVKKEEEKIKNKLKGKLTNYASVISVKWNE